MWRSLVPGIKFGNGTERKQAVGRLTKKVDWVLVALIACALALAWVNRFVQDDAFISFRYARNLAEGHGLVWNIGERVEGYTNFLWTLCMTPAFLFGVEPVFYSYVLSITAYACTLTASYSLAVGLWKSRTAGWVCVLLLATNFSFSSYATGGLETQFGIAWVMASVWLLERWRQDRSAWPLLCAGLASAGAVMTRMDAAVLLLPFWLGVTYVVWRGGDEKQKGLWVMAVCLAAAPLAGWLIWRHGFYGEWVPNTFLIKSAGVSWIRGTFYVGLFYLVYGFWLVVPVCMAGVKRLTMNLFLFCVCIGCLLWQVYVVMIGGDFMEFRLMMPALPLLLVLFSGWVSQGTIARWKKFMLIAGLMVFSLLQGLFQYPYPCIQTINDLRKYHAEWKACAETLNSALGEKKGDIKIAVTCAGIIPFYTGQPTLDLLGLNDRLIARSGESIKPPSRWIWNRPGHVKIADWQTVVDRGVNLLLNTPWVVEVSEADLAQWRAEDVVRYWFWGKNFDSTRVNAGMVRYPFAPGGQVAVPDVVAWRMGCGRYLMSIYMKKSSVVDAAIVRAGACVLRGTKEGNANQ